MRTLWASVWLMFFLAACGADGSAASNSNTDIYARATIAQLNRDAASLSTQMTIAAEVSTRELKAIAATATAGAIAAAATASSARKSQEAANAATSNALAVSATADARALTATAQASAQAAQAAATQSAASENAQATAQALVSTRATATAVFSAAAQEAAEAARISSQAETQAEIDKITAWFIPALFMLTAFTLAVTLLVGVSFYLRILIERSRVTNTAMGPVYILTPGQPPLFLDPVLRSQTLLLPPAAPEVVAETRETKETKTGLTDSFRVNGPRGSYYLSREAPLPSAQKAALVELLHLAIDCAGSASPSIPGWRVIQAHLQATDAAAKYSGGKWSRLVAPLVAAGLVDTSPGNGGGAVLVGEYRTLGGLLAGVRANRLQSTAPSPSRARSRTPA